MNHDDGRAAEDRAAQAAQASLRALIEQPVPSLSRAQIKHLEQRIAPRVEKLVARMADLRARNARRRRALAIAAAIAAALSVVSLGVVLLLRAPSAARVAAQVTVLKGSIEIASGRGKRSPPSLALVPIAGGEELCTSEGALARASLATGAAVEVGPSTRVRFTSGEPRPSGFDDTIALEEGRVSIDVPPLPAGVTLSVRTADTTVTVHGTRFAVERRVGPNGEPGETRVAVVEGRVAVRWGELERLLTRGQTWSSRDAEASVDAGVAETPPSRSGPAPDAPGRDETPADPPSAAREPARAPLRTTLKAENDLLEAAMEARRRGQPRRAIERIDRLLSRYPDSPLAEIARVERLEAQEMIAAGARGRRP
jgi:ferric-dicitrate binding protein FerR (iron transport regulator)